MLQKFCREARGCGAKSTSSCVVDGTTCWTRRIRLSRDQHFQRCNIFNNSANYRAGNALQTKNKRSTSVQSSRKSDASFSSLDEQEREFTAIEKLPEREQRYEALVGWIGAALAFGGGIWYTEGHEKAEEFFAGYILEQTLSIDNLFVFILVFKYFQTPEEVQPKVLQYGIISAAVLRLVFILCGVELIQSFEPVLIIFAGILIFSSYKLLATSGEDQEEDLSENAIVKFCNSSIKSTAEYDGDRFFTKLADGTTAATPLLLTLAVVELSDVIFAVDSIPAVFGVTLDPFIIYTSNLFAIFSLRSLYGFVSNVMTELRFLDKAVAVVLGFIGVKMLISFGDIEVPTDISLLFVGLVLGAGVGASLLLPEASQSEGSK